MEYVAIAVALIAWCVAWRNGSKLKYLQERLDATNNRYFSLINQVRETEETMQQQLMDLRVELKRQTGQLKFEPQMTIGEIYLSPISLSLYSKVAPPQILSTHPSHETRIESLQEHMPDALATYQASGHRTVCKH